MDYLLEAVGKRELFGLLRLEPEKWWHGLLFRDRYNLLGIAASIPPAVQESLSQQPGALTQVAPAQLSCRYMDTHPRPSGRLLGSCSSYSV